MSRPARPWLRFALPGLRRHSLRTRLMVWNMAILALLMGALGLVTRTLVRSMMLASVDRELFQRTQAFVAPPPRAGLPPPELGLPGGPGANPPPGLALRGPEGLPPPGQQAPEELPPDLLPMDPLPGAGGLLPEPPPGRLAGPPGATRTAQVTGTGRSRGSAAAKAGARAQPRPEAGSRSLIQGPGRALPQGTVDLTRRGDAVGAPFDGPNGIHPPLERPYPVQVIDLQGNVLNVARPSVPLHREGFRRAAGGELLFATITGEGGPVRVLSRPAPPRGRPRVVVQGAYPLIEVNRALAGLNRALLALVPLALLCAAMGGALLTRRVLQPVHRMAYAAGRIGAGDLSLRLPAAGKDEFAELAVTFNDMLTRLEISFHEKEQVVEQLQRLVEQQRRFTGDASHELRTPLAVIKANTSLCLHGRPGADDYRQSMEDIDRAATSMTRLVLDLLLLARSDSGQLGRNPITISIREVLERAAAQVAHREGATVRLRVPDDDLCVMGNEEELVRLFSNLLENALRYTPADGLITLAARRHGAQIQVAVADTGAGIAPEHIPHLGERFYRVDASRSRPDGGTGLGLSICRSIVDAHQGQIGFQSTVGVGTTVQVVLPAAPAHS